RSYSDPRAPHSCPARRSSDLGWHQVKWVSPWRLRRMGILGMNCRNRDFIGSYNPRHLFPLVDNKLKTKLIAEEYEVATPRLFFRSEEHTSELQSRENLVCRLL